MSLIIPANTLASGGFSVANSVRFNDGSSDNLSRSTGTPSSRQKFTFSTWIKLSSVSGNRSIFNIETDGNTTLFFMIKNGDQLHFVDYNSSAEQAKLTTNALYRDPSAWMHVVLRLDSTQGTNTNRCRLYVNGSEVTSFSATVYPSQNYNFTNNVGNTRIGVSQGNANYWDGYMAETVYCDGQSLAPDQFGEFDSDSNIWKPIDVSGLTFGDEGFYLDFENSGALGADVSGNTNNFTVNNLTAIDQSTDTCTTNYAVLNSLKFSAGTLSNGNLELDSSSASWKNRYSTIGVSSGKWFMEFKMGSISADQSGVAIVSDITLDGNSPGSDATRSPAIQYNSLNIKFVNGTATSSYFSAMSTNDIIGIALDMDNGTVQFYRNGSTTGSAIDLSDAFSTSQYPLFFCGTVYNTRDLQANFGSPSYSESGGETDGNGYGNFANAVPSGYYALNTKNLAEYG